MPSPQGNGSPSRYKPNQTDDRAITGPHRAAYFEVVTAIDAIENLYTREEWVTKEGKPAPLVTALSPDARRAVRTAESALRRAAFSIVLHADES